MLCSCWRGFWRYQSHRFWQSSGACQVEYSVSWGLCAGWVCCGHDTRQVRFVQRSEGWCPRPAESYSASVCNQPKSHLHKTWSSLYLSKHFKDNKNMFTIYKYMGYCKERWNNRKLVEMGPIPDSKVWSLTRTQKQMLLVWWFQVKCWILLQDSGLDCDTYLKHYTFYCNVNVT